MRFVYSKTGWNTQNRVEHVIRTDKKISDLKSTGEKYHEKLGQGLFVTVSATKGGKTFWVRARSRRYPGKVRTFTLGTFPEINLDTARKMAIDLKARIRSGDEPPMKEDAPTGSLRAPETVAELCADFIERYAKPRNRAWKATQGLLTRYVVPAWGKRPIASIKQADVVQLLDKVVASGKPIAANRLLAAIRKMWNWGIESAICSSSPCDRVRARAKEVSRDRVLSADELAAILGCRGGIEIR